MLAAASRESADCPPTGCVGAVPEDLLGATSLPGGSIATRVGVKCAGLCVFAKGCPAGYVGATRLASVAAGVTVVAVGLPSYFMLCFASGLVSTIGEAA